MLRAIGLDYIMGNEEEALGCLSWIRDGRLVQYNRDESGREENGALLIKLIKVLEIIGLGLY